eukprot:4151297-Pyramimonas_sp.AAC.1
MFERSAISAHALGQGPRRGLLGRLFPNGPSGLLGMLSRSGLLDPLELALLGPVVAPSLACFNAPVAHWAGEFRRMLVGMYLSGEMSAQKIVRIAFLATKAGSTGCEDFARDVKHNKNCARLLNGVLRCDEVRQQCLHITTMPVNKSRGRRRAVREPVSTIPIFEVLARQFTKDPN